MDEEHKLKLAREYAFQNTLDDDLAHDCGHIDRVVKIAVSLARDYSCDLFLLQMVALLHDVEDSKLNVPDANDMSMFLDSLQLGYETKETILYILPFMSFSKFPVLPDDFPIEGKIVQDADRLDAIGAIGIGRTFLYGAFHNIPMYSQDDSVPSTLKHFSEKLLKLHNYLYTDVAKQIAKKRAKIIKDFYKEFNYEIHQFDE